MFLLALPRPASAGWPNDPTVNVPLSINLCTAERTSITADGGGGAIVAWQDCRNGGPDIYAQHVRADGIPDPRWPVNGLAICTLFGSQAGPVIISDGMGGAVITWSDNRAFTGYNIYAQHVLANGLVDPTWPVNGIAVNLTDGPDAELYPAMISDGAGGALICWSDVRDAKWKIYAHHVLAGGIVDPLWPVNGMELSSTGAREFDGPGPAIVSDGLGGGIVTWQDSRNANDIDIYAQRVRAIGLLDPAWPDTGRAVCAAPGDQRSPVIVSDGAGGAIVAWMDSRSGSGADIYAGHVPAGGEQDPTWPVDGARPLRCLRYAILARADFGRHRGAIVAWWDARGGDESDVYAQHVRYGGLLDPAWPSDGLAICQLSGDQRPYAIESDGAGGAIFAWIDYRSGTAAVYAQHAPGSGSIGGPWPANGRAVCTAGVGRTYLVSEVDGSGGVILSWADYRNPGGGIYAQRVDSYGLLGTPPVGVTTEELLELRLAVWPNPASSGRMAVSFVLPVAALARLELVDVKGRLVAVREVGSLGAGRHVVDLVAGRKLQTGIYLVRLTQGGLQRTGRAVVLD